MVDGAVQVSAAVFRSLNLTELRKTSSQAFSLPLYDNPSEQFETILVLLLWLQVSFKLTKLPPTWPSFLLEDADVDAAVNMEMFGI